MTLGFKGRIYASVVILVTISLMVLGTINMLSLKREMIDSLTTETQNKLNYHVSELEFWVKSRYEAVSRGANLFTPELSDTDNLNKVRLLAEAAQITNVIAAYEDGRSYMSMDKEGGVTTNRFKFTDRDWYQQAKSRRSPFLTEIYQDQVTGKKVISAVSPILHQGQFVGALLGDFQLDDIITSETDQVVTAITQMSESARTVAESVTQSNQITEAASKEAQQSLVIVNNAVSTVTSLVNDVENMSESISNMNRDANKISEVLSVIGAISEQTNLLALNAAIEAARAGEQGRGFAVVADEVRALAARTQNSTTEISDMLTKLLEGTDSVVGAMERTKQQCQTTADKTSEVSGSLNMMSASVSDIDDLSTQIAAATEQQSTVAAELSRNMLSIREIVESLVVSGRQTVGATESLSHSNHELEQLVGKFKLR
ncbi:methyl-accepting chemotaxis protein [Vibrio cholerae]